MVERLFTYKNVTEILHSLIEAAMELSTPDSTAPDSTEAPPDSTAASDSTEAPDSTVVNDLTAPLPEDNSSPVVHYRRIRTRVFSSDSSEDENSPIVKRIKQSSSSEEGYCFKPFTKSVQRTGGSSKSVASNKMVKTVGGEKIGGRKDAKKKKEYIKKSKEEMKKPGKSEKENIGGRKDEKDSRKKKEYKIKSEEEIKKPRKSENENIIMSKQKEVDVKEFNPGTRYVVIRNPKLNQANMHFLSAMLDKFSPHKLVGGEDRQGKKVFLLLSSINKLVLDLNFYLLIICWSDPRV